jgi:predicted ATPase/class 3 adenylate cyclase
LLSSSFSDLIRIGYVPVKLRSQEGTMSSLPTGTVTFLFTDIEGSVPLWERDPAAMEASLQVLNAVLNQAIAEQGGIVFQVAGDEIDAAFPTAPQALAAALDAQRGLLSADWNELGPLRVRMGLHTGEAHLDEYGKDYAVSHAKNRASRVMNAGNGGQILLSQESADLCKRNLPLGVDLKDLGEHKVKGMVLPEHLYQLVSADLPQDFPPLRTQTPIKNNLPRQLTSFVGREKEIAHVKDLLGQYALVTLTGAGGVGKTRLALQVAQEVLDRYPEGVWLVELAALADPGLVLQQIATVLGIQESAEESLRSSQQRLSLLQRLTNSLQEKHLLLILDNCEHVIDACARLVDHLLHHCTNLCILTSSREPLGIEGEIALRVPSLSLPEVEEIDLDKVADSEAVLLFIDRASAILPGFTMTRENVRFINKICIRLDGIALAIELAASRVRLLGVEQIASRLDDAFHLLTGGKRTALPRHQTLRATIDWSYDLLPESERLLLERLSVFQGGWTLQTAEVVCAGDGIEGDIVLERMTQLENKSLIICEFNARGISPLEERRCRLLEATRLYAWEKLRGHGSEVRIHMHHLDFFMKLAEALEVKIDTKERSVILKQVDSELDNFRAAMEWAFKHWDSSNWVKGLCIASALCQYWILRGYFQEGINWLERGLTRSDESNGELNFVRAKAYFAIGNLENFLPPHNSRQFLEKSILLFRELRQVGEGYLSKALKSLAFCYENDPQHLRVLIEESIAICRSSEKCSGYDLAEALAWLGHGYYIQENYSVARAYAEESIKISKQKGILQDGHSACVLGNIAFKLSDLDGARHYWEESVQLFWEAENKPIAIYHYGKLMGIDFALKDYATAKRRAEECFQAWCDMGDRERGDVFYMYSGIFAIFQGDYEIAENRLRESLARIPDPQSISLDLVLNLAGLSELARIGGEIKRAGRLLGAAEAMLTTSGLSISTGPLKYLMEIGQASLDEETLEEGSKMTIEQAIAYALTEKPYF